MANGITSEKSPWLWVPTLYFAQGIPYVVVMTVSVVMYKRLGISNAAITLYTSWLYLPWVIKGLWSPFVDLFRTKRFWIVALQLVVGASLACVALTLPGPRFFQFTLAVFWLMAFASATHDIAADGFYMLGLEQHQQAAFAGVRSTFYRIATIAAQGLLVMLAGQIESRTGLPPLEITVHAQPGAMNTNVEERPAESPGAHLLASPSRLDIDTAPQSGQTIAEALRNAKQSNLSNGFTLAEQAAAKAKKSESRIAGFVRAWFGEPPRKAVDVSGSIGVVSLRLSRAPDAGEQTVVNLAQAGGDTSISVVEGARLVFTDQNWDKPAMLVFQLDPKLRTASQTHFIATAGNTVLAWIICFGVLVALFVLLAGYHQVVLPRPAADGAVRTHSGTRSVLAEFVHTFALFFQKPGIILILAFLLFYRFAEAQLVKLVAPFLLDPREVGGLGLTTGQLGFVYGTVGIASLTVGGLLGGFVIARQGLRFWLWIMVLAIHLPDLAFVFLAYVQPENQMVINLAIAIEQFGYGFGFTAYMLFMIMISQGEHKTAHYAICTGFMALGMMLPGMFSGWLQELIGYRHFFVWVMLSTIPGFLVAALVRIEPGFGRKTPRDEGLRETPAKSITPESVAAED